ncbi:MAG: hypothetical protein V1899_06945 [Planctomycetota bacterium]
MLNFQLSIHNQKSTIKNSLILSALVILGVCSFSRAGEAGDDQKSGKNIYFYWERDGVPFRFDMRTNKAEKLVFTANGFVAIEVPINVSDQPPTSQKIAKSNENKKEIGLAVMDNTNKKSPNRIRIENAAGQDITDEITDTDRKTALPDIAGYEKELATSLVLKSDDRINGIIMVTNKGARKIEKLELTLAVPINGKEKPEEHRFLFAEKGPVAPPPPSANGADGATLMQKVDLPSPPGGVKGNPNLKISYIKFCDK